MLKHVATYVVAVFSAIVAFQITWLIRPYLSLPAPFIVYFAVVVFVAWYGGRWPALIATGIYALLVEFYLVAPVHTLDVTASPDIAALLLFVLVARMITYGIDRWRASHETTSYYQRQLERLQDLSGRLVAETSFESMLEEVLKASIDLLSAEKGVVQIYDSNERVLRMITQNGFPEQFSRRFDRVPVGCYTWAAS